MIRRGHVIIIPSKPQRAFSLIWICTGFVAGLVNATWIEALIGAGLGLAVAYALERLYQTSYYENVVPESLMPLILMGIFTIPGLLGGASTTIGLVAGVALGIKLGALHGGMLALGLIQVGKDEKWCVIIPAISMGVGTGCGCLIGAFSGIILFGGAIGGLIGAVAGCILFIFIGTFNIWDVTQPTWKGHDGLPLLYCICNFTIATIIDLLGIFSAWGFTGSLIALCMFILYDIIMFPGEKAYW
jgi:hypothetical protein